MTDKQVDAKKNGAPDPSALEASASEAVIIDAFIALGANLDEPVAQLQRALRELAQLTESRLCVYSTFYASKPVGYVDQPDYVNAVAHIKTRLSPHTLLDALLEIESRHGRRRDFKNAPRTLDLDLLLYNGLIMHEPGLTLPHPRMLARAFVMVPLAEIAPDVLIPGQSGCQSRAQSYLSKLDSSELTRLPTDLGAYLSAAARHTNEQRVSQSAR